MALTKRDYKHNWPKVQAEVDALWAQRKMTDHGQVIKQAIAATSGPNDGKDTNELENIASYHAQLLDGADCECAVCGAFYRMEGVW